MSSISGQTLAYPSQTYTWNDPCFGGPVSVTLRVYVNGGQAPPTYRWDYEVTNQGFSPPGPTLSQKTGLPYWVVNFAVPVPEVAQPYAQDANNDPDPNWTTQVDPVNGFTAYTSLSTGLMPGQTMHFGFTTGQRPVVQLTACGAIASPNNPICGGFSSGCIGG